MLCGHVLLSCCRKGKDELLVELKRSQVPLEVRKLHVGDFCWIARSNTGLLRIFLSQLFVCFVEVVFAGGCAEELVLNEIVERKRMDDLACSITDRRFKEQKVNC